MFRRRRRDGNGVVCISNFISFFHNSVRFFVEFIARVRFYVCLLSRHSTQTHRLILGTKYGCSECMHAFILMPSLISDSHVNVSSITWELLTIPMSYAPMHRCISAAVVRDSNHTQTQREENISSNKNGLEFVFEFEFHLCYIVCFNAGNWVEIL